MSRVGLYVEQYGMVWYGMVWHGMAWHGMAWHGMVWYGMLTEKIITEKILLLIQYLIKYMICLETTLTVRE